jgi:hypothetical protein
MLVYTWPCCPAGAGDVSRVWRALRREAKQSQGVGVRLDSVNGEGIEVGLFSVKVKVEGEARAAKGVNGSVETAPLLDSAPEPGVGERHGRLESRITWPQAGSGTARGTLRHSDSAATSLLWRAPYPRFDQP